mgnify:FL=1
MKIMKKIIPGGRFIALLAGFFFLFTGGTAYGAASFPNMTTYLIRVVIALSILGGASWILVHYVRPGKAFKQDSRLQVLSTLRLGREVLYVVKCGPDVLALLVGSNSKVVGKWGYEEWLQGEGHGEKKDC